MIDKCPYCDERVEINHDDGYGLEEDGQHQQECGCCGKTFVYRTCIIIDHVLEKSDCLNGLSDHDFKPSKTYPKWMTYMQCSTCGLDRQLTDVERRLFSIPERPKLEKP